jgi:hypothetical protein
MAVMSASRTGRTILPINIFNSVSGSHLYQRLSKPQGLVRLEGLGKLIKMIHLKLSGPRDPPACSVVPNHDANALRLYWCTPPPHCAHVNLFFTFALCGQLLLMYDLSFSRRWLWRMSSYGMLRLVALVRTEVSGELSASFIRVTRIGELGKTLACVGC